MRTHELSFMDNITIKFRFNSFWSIWVRKNEDCAGGGCGGDHGDEGDAELLTNKEVTSLHLYFTVRLI
jgi:hypothetical protein